MSLYIVVYQNHWEKCQPRMEPTHKCPSEGMKDVLKCKWEVLDSTHSNTAALSVSVVSIHVWAHQADYVRLVRTKFTSARLSLEWFDLGHCLTCHLSLHRDCLTNDDAIGTTFLNLTTMSSSGGEIEGDNQWWFVYCFAQLAKHWIYFFPLSTNTDTRAETGNALSECTRFMVFGSISIKEKSRRVYC